MRFAACAWNARFLIVDVWSLRSFAVFALLTPALHGTVPAMLTMNRLFARDPRDVSLSSCLLLVSGRVIITQR